MTCFKLILDDYFIYDELRHLNKIRKITNLDRFPRGKQNVKQERIFGYKSHFWCGRIYISNKHKNFKCINLSKEEVAFGLILDIIEVGTIKNTFLIKIEHLLDAQTGKDYIDIIKRFIGV